MTDNRHLTPITERTLSELPDLLYGQIMASYRIAGLMPTELAGQVWLNDSRRQHQRGGR